MKKQSITKYIKACCKKEQEPEVSIKKKRNQLIKITLFPFFCATCKKKTNLIRVY